MVDDVTSILEKMKLTLEEEEVIEISEEGRKEGMESYALSFDWEVSHLSAIQ